MLFVCLFVFGDLLECLRRRRQTVGGLPFQEVLKLEFEVNNQEMDTKCKIDYYQRSR